VSVIVPFRGSDAQLARLRARLGALALRPDDELIVSDNRRHPVRTPAFARNDGAERARGEWLVFIDADTIPHPHLVDAYFDPPPADRTALQAGAVHDVAASARSLVARHGVARSQLSQRTTLVRAGTPYAQTANCAVRRSAFQAIGGFDAGARAGEDADLCFRLRHAGWGIEERLAARVDHEGRATIGGWLWQLVVHGSGAAWLERRWPGEFPASPPARLLARLARHLLRALRALARGETQEAAFQLLDLIGACAFEAGRLLPNRRPVLALGWRLHREGARKLAG
jgi:GT2 family glycosyltransferase